MSASPAGLTARRMSPADERRVAGWFAHPVIRHFVAEADSTPHEIRELSAELVRADPFADGQCGYIFEFDGEPVAVAHYMWFNWISRTVEVDFFLVPGKKVNPFLAYLVIKRIVGIVFEDFNLHKVYCFIYSSNTVIFNLISKWMKVEAVMQGYLKHGERCEDVYIMGLLSHEYDAMKKAPLARRHPEPSTQTGATP